VGSASQNPIELHIPLQEQLYFFIFTGIKFMWWKSIPILFNIRDSKVSIATGYGLDNLGVDIQDQLRSRISTGTHHSDRLWGPPSLLFNGYWGIFSMGKLPEE
jgi:hypothetical protein